MATLTILGHATRGDEVIEILKMLGGENFYNEDTGRIDMVFYISDDKRIGALGYEYVKKTNATIFTLEEFLEKFPYKVGDKVCFSDNTKQCLTIKKIWWNCDCSDLECTFYEDDIDVSMKDLQPYKGQETMEESIKMNIVNNDCNNIKINTTTELCENKVITFAKCTLDEVELDLADKFEIVLKEGKYFAVKKKPQYPKTYEGCLKILGISKEMTLEEKAPILGYRIKLLSSLQKLLISRDVYWKIAGWKPDWKDFGVNKYCISTDKNRVCPCNRATGNKPLAFPTEEMRNAFYENFKELIEECKELL